MSVDDTRAMRIERIKSQLRAIREHRAVELARLSSFPDIAPRQMETLLYLCSQPLPKASMGWIARALGVMLPTATGIVDRLVTMGLTVREEDPNDRRLVLVSVSAAGHALVKHWYDRFDEFAVSLVADLPDEELDAAIGVLQAIANSATTPTPQLP